MGANPQSDFQGVNGRFQAAVQAVLAGKEGSIEAFEAAVMGVPLITVIPEMTELLGADLPADVSERVQRALNASIPGDMDKIREAIPSDLALATAYRAQPNFQNHKKVISELEEGAYFFMHGAKQFDALSPHLQLLDRVQQSQLATMLATEISRFCKILPTLRPRSKLTRILRCSPNTRWSWRRRAFLARMFSFNVVTNYYHLSALLCDVRRKSLWQHCKVIIFLCLQPMMRG